MANLFRLALAVWSLGRWRYAQGTAREARLHGTMHPGWSRPATARTCPATPLQRARAFGATPLGVVSASGRP